MILWLPNLGMGASPIAALIYVTPDGATPFVYTATEWGQGVVFTLEAYLLASSGTVYARLYDSTSAAEVTDSEVSTAAGSYTRCRSSSLTLTDGHEYVVQLGQSGSDAGSVKGCPRLIAV